MTTTPAPPRSERLHFARFTEQDAAGLARLLSDPEVTRTITANGSTPERCRTTAKARIAWHNGAWDQLGYGVWALRPGDGKPLIGWCGFAAPDLDGHDPEILYGLERSVWGQGLALEAAKAALGWLFRETALPGVSALIFQRLNPGSLRVADKLGLTRRGTMDYKDFMQDPPLARDVLDYEVWRLRAGPCLDPEALLFQAPYKAGQLVATGIVDAAPVEAALCQAARERPSFLKTDPAELDARVRHAFRQGQAESHVDWYHLSREDWQSEQGLGS